MIFQSLLNRYDNLVNEGNLPLKGWSNEKISFGLDLNEAGEIIQVIDLRDEIVRGKSKKTILKPIIRMMPERIMRSTNIESNFLYDNAMYILGLDSKGNLEKSIERFKAAKEKHLAILEDCKSEAAISIKNFFTNWKPSDINDHEILKSYLDKIKDDNITFTFNGKLAVNTEEIKNAYMKYLEETQNLLEDNKRMRCLITGKKEIVERTHPTIRGVFKAQSSGARIVSFSKDSPSFESYGNLKQQSYNSPFSKKATFAYTTVLNNLLQDKKHSRHLGDTTILYWAEKTDEKYQDIFYYLLFGDEKNLIDSEYVDSIIDDLNNGESITYNDIKLDLKTPFYILGLAPNTARISIRFYLESTFGEVLKNIIKHHKDMEIVSPKNKYISLFRLESALVTSKSNDRVLTPILVGHIFKAIFLNSPYPEAMLSQAVSRTRLESDTKNGDKGFANYKISHIRCAMIKAYYLRQGRNILVELNKNEKCTAYLLGRIFSVLEIIQKKSGSEITIKDRYFNMYCSSPQRIFPILNRKSQFYLKKLKGGLKVYYEKMLRELMVQLDVDSLPEVLPLEQQGLVVLGYYHQTQKMYTKKEEDDENKGD